MVAPAGRSALARVEVARVGAQRAPPGQPPLAPVATTSVDFLHLCAPRRRVRTLKGYPCSIRDPEGGAHAGGGRQPIPRRPSFGITEIAVDVFSAEQGDEPSAVATERLTYANVERSVLAASTGRRHKCGTVARA